MIPLLVLLALAWRVSLGGEVPTLMLQSGLAGMGLTIFKPKLIKIT